ncbi:hypothetical protein StoSoilB13_04930 [Arthrobacter sp. StoSoilB13]|nr:hypothetical protein StoSoilB13_04930 [Arthrobacter sp. StoSoilB13]
MPALRLSTGRQPHSNDGGRQGFAVAGLADSQDEVYELACLPSDVSETGPNLTPNLAGSDVRLGCALTGLSELTLASFWVCRGRCGSHAQVLRANEAINPSVA